MTYARARLWLSLSGIATIVGFALFALLLNITALLPSRPAAFVLELQSLLAVALLYAFLLLPFDLFGGYILPREYGQPTPSLLDFGLNWGRGVVVQSVIFIASAATLMVIGRSLSFVPFVFTAGLLMLVLILTQKNIAMGMAHFTPTTADLTPYQEQLDQWGLSLPDLVVLDSAENAFTGGIVGFPGADEVLVPAAWLNQLPPLTAAYHLARRAEAIQTGGRRRGIWLAWAWNLIGLVLTAVLLANRIHLGSVSGVVTLGLGQTIWSFVGLLVLGGANRAAVYQLDRYLNVLGWETSQVELALNALDERQAGTSASAHALLGQRYDLPSVTERLDALRQSSTGADRTTWQVTRQMLYLSWPLLGFLGRALPAQLGRPELWALPPSE